MNKISFFFLALVLAFSISCGKKKPTDKPTDDPIGTIKENPGSDEPGGEPTALTGQDGPAAGIEDPIEAGSSAPSLGTAARVNYDFNVVYKCKTPKCRYDVLKRYSPRLTNTQKVACTKAGSADKTFSINTYDNTPGEGLICDIVDDSDNEMMFFAYNTRRWCSANPSPWRRFKQELANNGWTCNDPTGSFPQPTVALAPSPAPEPEPTPQPATPEAPAAPSIVSITNTADDGFRVALGGQFITLSQGECVRINADRFNELMITNVNANRNDVCLLGECGQAGSYTIEQQNRIFRRDLYTLEPSSLNTNCNNYSLGL